MHFATACQTFYLSIFFSALLLVASLSLATNRECASVRLFFCYVLHIFIHHHHIFVLLYLLLRFSIYSDIFSYVCLALWYDWLHFYSVNCCVCWWWLSIILWSWIYAAACIYFDVFSLLLWLKCHVIMHFCAALLNFFILKYRSINLSKKLRRRQHTCPKDKGAQQKLF